MARQIGKLTPFAVKGKKEKGLYSDGGNLYLQVNSSGAKSWLFRFELNGKVRDMGLGSCNAITLAYARELATAARKHVSLNVDPIAARKEEQAKASLEAAKTQTFKQCAETYIETHKSGWRNPKHISQWTNTLTTYVYPVFGDISVQDVDTDLVIKSLMPIWNTKTETATRIRGRIENILDWAKAMKLRTGENPALWRGHLQKLLPKPSKVQKVEHHPSLPYIYVAEFMAGLSTNEDLSARALELTILTASRTSEVRAARWEEFDLKQKIWVVPATRIKTGKEHRVPLSPAALAILKELHKNRNNDFVFAGRNPTKCMSDMALLALTRRMAKPDYWPYFVVHGFRSSFRDWAAEQTNFPREVCETCLSHSVNSKTEEAYQRSDLLEKRKLVLDAWARYCYQPQVKGNKVVVGNFGNGDK